ncbi:MAG: tetratricopeptide repeat protein [Gammaproteobacteria bacterium]
MSLVNDMLRDLNKRTPVSNRAARVHGAMQSSIENKRPRTRTGLILAGGMLAGLLAGYFYFESAGVEVTQVPLAVVPAPAPAQNAASSPPAVQDSVAPVAVQPAVSGPEDAMPAIESVVEIRELAMQPNGFTLLIEASEEAPFEILERSANRLILHLAGVDRYERGGASLPGMSLLLVGDGLEFGIDVERAADFLVREDSETPGFDILITVSYRHDDVTTIGEAAFEPQPELAQAPVLEAQPELTETPVLEAGIAPAEALTEAGQATSTGERQASVRVSRELSLEERDRNNSQEALKLVQGGRLVEAYDLLRSFIGENPAGHQSRETLAKILFAQHEYAQAGAVVDDGLQQVPNYGPFKKIKARLLMQANESEQALALLRNVPPDVAADPEYHELLGSLYQQGNLHAQAVATYQGLLRLDRQQGRWWTGLAISLEAQDKDGDALASYQAALQTRNLDANLRQFIQGRIRNLDLPQ